MFLFEVSFWFFGREDLGILSMFCRCGCLCVGFRSVIVVSGDVFFI